MNQDWPVICFTGLMLLCVIVQGFFTMLEMACLSFPKSRLAYYVELGDARARLIHDFLSHPNRFFGTTVLCITLALQIGTMASHRLAILLEMPCMLAMGLEICLVLICAELLPLLLGKTYPEPIALYGVRILHLFGYLLRPMTYCFEQLSSVLEMYFGKPKNRMRMRTRIEIQRFLNDTRPSSAHHMHTTHILDLHKKTARDFMKPIRKKRLVAFNSTAYFLKKNSQIDEEPFVLIYHGAIDRIIGVAYVEDYMDAADTAEVALFSREPWCVEEKKNGLKLLEGFKRLRHRVAVVLDRNGVAKGTVTLEELMLYIFTDHAC